jgi:hypothetical protein
MTDPVQDANDDHERQVLEIAHLDAQLNNQQQRLDQLADEDPVGFVWFGDNDTWLDKRLNDPGGGSTP